MDVKYHFVSSYENRIPNGRNANVDAQVRIDQSLSSVNSLIQLPLRQFTVEFPSLTGVSRARQLLAKLIIWTATESPKGTLILDFNNVGDASASFLRESILAFRDYVRVYQPELFPVLANISDAVREEFNTLLRDRGEAMPGCRLDASGAPVDPEVLGVLEPGLSHTLDIIRSRGQMTLKDLRDTSQATKPTTWSNRIASLIRQGFVVPIPEPNKRVYQFVLAEVGGVNGA